MIDLPSLSLGAALAFMFVAGAICDMCVRKAVLALRNKSNLPY